jgi:replication factor C subunit 1
VTGILIVAEFHVFQSAVEDVIERMDEYYLSREDWDTVVELGVDQNKDDQVLKKISAATKTTLTKKCVH